MSHTATVLRLDASREACSLLINLSLDFEETPPAAFARPLADALLAARPALLALLPLLPGLPRRL